MPLFIRKGRGNLPQTARACAVMVNYITAHARTVCSWACLQTEPVAMAFQGKSVEEMGEWLRGEGFSESVMTIFKGKQA